MIAALDNRRQLRFDTYVKWAEGQGCEIREEHLVRDHGQTVKLVTLTMPNGKWATEVTSEDDYLISTTVARIDRRLGVKSNFF